MAIDQKEQQCIDIILENHPGDSWIYTNDRFSELDGLFVRNGVVRAVAEIKAREKPLGTYEKEMLGWNKMEAGQWASKAFRCPFYLFSYHPMNDVVAAYRITDEAGQFIRKFDVSDYEQNRTSEDRQNKIVRKTAWVENKDPGLLARRGLRCIY